MPRGAVTSPPAPPARRGPKPGPRSLLKRNSSSDDSVSKRDLSKVDTPLPKQKDDSWPKINLSFDETPLPSSLLKRNTSDKKNLSESDTPLPRNLLKRNSSDDSATKSETPASKKPRGRPRGTPKSAARSPADAPAQNAPAQASRSEVVPWVAPAEAPIAALVPVETAAAKGAREQEEAVVASLLEEFRAEFDNHAVPLESRRRLAPLIDRWGRGRVTQILGLWTFLGDGSFRSVSASTLQVWGPPGTGKTAVVSDYLGKLNIRHIRLNCASFTSLGELNGRLIELLQRNTASAGAAPAIKVPFHKTPILADDMGKFRIINGQRIDMLGGVTGKVVVRADGAPADTVPILADDMSKFRIIAAPTLKFHTGQQVRSLDKMETLLRQPLEALSRTSTDEGTTGLPTSRNKPVLSFSMGEATAVPEAPVKIVVVLDQAQDIPDRFGSGALDLLINLPEVLQLGNQLAIVVIGLLRLGSLGVQPNREPPAVAFQAYTEAEATTALKGVLLKEFPSVQAAPEPGSASSTASASSSGSRSTVSPADVCTGLMKFAWPHLGRNLQQLLSVGRQLLREGLPSSGSAFSEHFQQRVLKAVQQRLGVCDLRGLLKRGMECENMDSATIAAIVTLKQLTRAEMRLILSAYLAGYVEKEDDLQLFMPPELRRKGQKRRETKKKQDEQPIYTRAPTATSLSRLLAVYHRLARRPQLLGPPIFEHLASLREAGLIRFAAERACLDTDIKVTCRAQLPLVRAIASELNIDLAEYLTKY